MNTVNVVCAVLRDGNKIFAARRGYGKYKGFWEFPGGKIENGETPEQALKRELSEELDIEISVGDLTGTVEYDCPEFHLCMKCFWAEISGGKMLVKEHEEVRWLGPDELHGVQWLPSDDGLLVLIESALRGQ